MPLPERPRCAWCTHELLSQYHDEEWGQLHTDEAALFELLTLEIFQAGLSWLTILKRREGFRTAFHAFDIDKVARYTDRDRERLLNDERIIRNRAKIDATLKNAKAVRELRAEGGFAAWMDAGRALSLDEWTKRFKGRFAFTGGEIVKMFVWGSGYVYEPHEPECWMYVAPKMSRARKQSS